MVESSCEVFQHDILKVKEGGGIIIMYEVNTCTSHTFEITIIICASDNAPWLCVSSRYLVQYMIFHKPWIWMVESSVELFLDAILKVRGGGIIGIIYEVKTSPTMEIILTLCASDNALWLCVSSNYLVQYMIFHIIIQLGGFC